jgi:hypothetical protein
MTPIRPDPAQTVSQSGAAAAKVPTAPASEPITLYRANMAVRRRGSAVWASAVCSSGRKMLASPDVGFIVPTKAISSSGQNAVVTAKPRPVAAISKAEPSSSRRTE